MTILLCVLAPLRLVLLSPQYTRRVLTRDGRATSTHVLRMTAGLADAAIFLQIGLNVMLNLGRGSYDAAFIAATVAACLIARAANIFPIAAALNLWRKDRISPAFQLQVRALGIG